MKQFIVINAETASVGFGVEGLQAPLPTAVPGSAFTASS